MRQAELWRSRIDREGRKAKKRVAARLDELKQRAKRDRRTLTRSADEAVARALAANSTSRRGTRSSKSAAPGRAAEGAGGTPALGNAGVTTAAPDPLSRRLTPGMSRSTRATRRSRPRRRSKAALVCAGGGVTGAVYEIGCLRAIEDLLDRSVIDFDMYVGVSGGAFVASLLASGISPREIYAEVTAPTPPAGHLGRPAVPARLRDLLSPRAARAGLPGDARIAGSRRGPRLADGVVPARAAAAGLLDNSGVQEWPRASGPSAGSATASTICGASCSWWRWTSTAARPSPSASRRIATSRSRRPSRRRRRCRASTARCASAAATTWTAASRRPPTSTWRSRTAPTW